MQQTPSSDHGQGEAVATSHGTARAFEHFWSPGEAFLDRCGGIGLPPWLESTRFIGGIWPYFGG